MDMSKVQVQFAALLSAYQKKNNEIATSSILYRDQIKANRPRAIENAVQLIKDRNAFGSFFTSTTLLVPVPSSSKLKTPQSEKYATEVLCEALISHGLGKSTRRLLLRDTAIRKSSHCISSERPTVKEHYDTLTCDLQLPLGIDQILIVDDVVTRGSVSMACFKHLERNFPETDIKIFSFFKTETFEDCSDTFILLKEGVINFYSSGKTFVFPD